LEHPPHSGEPIGRGHAVVRRLRALRRDRALRDSESVLVAEGTRLVREALASGAEIELIVTSPRLRERAEGAGLARELARAGPPCYETADSVLESVQDARGAQPVLAVVRRPAWTEGTGLTPPAPLVVVACGLQDPGNLGALVRSAEAAGATACFVCGDSVDPFHPRAVRATMGSIFRLPLFVASPLDLLRRLRQHGIAALAASAHEGRDYRLADLRRPVALFLGREGSGLPDELDAALDGRIRIPLRPPVESLSVGAAAAVLLFEAARQREAAVSGDA